jgi:Fungal trichothecene efflux pump (TRI12)
LITIPDRTKPENAEKSTLRSLFTKLDIIGFSIFAPFAIMLLLPLEWGGTKYAWDSATIIGLFCGAGAMLIVFVVWEYRVGENAMIPYSMVKQQIVWSSCLSMGFFFGSAMILSYYLPIYFQSVKGASPAMSGVYILPSILSQLVMAIISGIMGKSTIGPCLRRDGC